MNQVLVQITEVEWLNLAHVVDIADDPENDLIVVTTHCVNEIGRRVSFRWTGASRAGLLRALQRHAA